MSSNERLEFAPPPTPGLVRAMLLALLAHGALVAVLAVGVQWKHQTAPVTVEAELWSALPVQAAAPAAEEVPPEPPKPPEPVPEPKPEPKPEPVVVPKPAPQPDPAIALAKEKEKAKLAKEKNKYGSAPLCEVDFASSCPRCSAKRDGKSCSPILHIGSHYICEYWYRHQKEEIARSSASFIKIQDDPRITRVGKIIRDLSIDELPQLINVIKGDMSLVGNRPLPVYEAEKLTNDQMATRFLSPAGLTGLWQVELRGRAGEMSEEERKRLDNK